MTAFTNKVKKFGPRMKKDLEINDVQVAGIFGNLGAETGGFTLLQEKNPLVKGSRGGYGWMQWTGPRRKKYEAWAAVNNLNLADDETNYKYLVHETKTEEGKSLQYLRQAKTVEQAVETFCNKNLRPGIPHMDSRKRWGMKAYAALITKPTPKTDTAVVTGTVGTGAVVAATNPSSWPYVVGAVVVGLILYFGYKALKKRFIKDVQKD